MYYLVCSLTYCLHKFGKRTKKKNLSYLIEYPHFRIDVFTTWSEKPAIYLVSKCADISEQNSMR